MSDETWLVIRGIASSRWAHRLPSQRQNVGRGVECDVHVPHSTVSRRHAEIQRQFGLFFVRDLNSRNGTYVDGERVETCQFSVGSVLEVGRVTLDVVAGPLSLTEVDLDTPTAGGSGEILVESRSDVNCAVLTHAQKRVLRLLLQGHSEKEVGKALFISRHTVHTHLKEIYRSLGVHSRAEMMALFVSQTSLALPRIEVPVKHE